jgi:4'-phosphopantetheinyl transferase
MCGQPGHGKPRVEEGGPHFSISHAGDYVVVAVTDDGPMGVDVELITRGDDKIDRRVRADSERSAGGADLMRRWVRKEAVLKATGHGLAVPMTRFAVSPPDAPACLLTWPDDSTLPDRLRLYDLPCPRLYAAAVAVIGRRRGPVLCRDGSARLAALA